MDIFGAHCFGAIFPIGRALPIGEICKGAWIGGAENVVGSLRAEDVNRAIEKLAETRVIHERAILWPCERGCTSDSVRKGCAVCLANVPP